MFIPTSPTLNPLLALKALFSGKLEPKNRLMYFSFARAGLITAIESIRFNNRIIGKSSIWLPAYICDTVVIILREYSVNCKYYKVTADLKPDFDALEKENICQEDFFLLVHYFGFSISQKETIDFCKRKKLYLIEDCAHSIVKDIGKSKIGTQGDAGIFGLRKVPKECEWIRSNASCFHLEYVLLSVLLVVDVSEKTTRNFDLIRR